MEGREKTRMHKYGETMKTRIMMVAVRDVTSGSGLSGRLIFAVQSVHRSLELRKFYSCQMLTKLEFSRQIIKEIPQ